MPEDSSAMCQQEVSCFPASAKVAKETYSASGSPGQIRCVKLESFKFAFKCNTLVPPAEIFLG